VGQGEEEYFLFSFFFSNTSNTFSNSFCTPFLLEIKTNQSQIKYAAACMHKHVANLIFDFIFLKIIISLNFHAHINA
jgi:hypothetical protein